VEEQETIAVTTDAEQPSSEQTRVERLVSPFYDRDGITIYNADCRDVLPMLGRFDLLLTDPPYGIGKAWEGGGWQVNCGKSRMWNEDKAPDWDKRQEVAEWIDTAATAIVWGGNFFALPVSRGWLVWDKTAETVQSQAELAWTNRDGGVRIHRLSPLGVFGNGGLNGERKTHPTQKPLQLMKWCIGLVPEAKSVLDPFMGSGTTLVAAKLLGLRAVGIEINREYCEAAVQRLRQGVLGFDSEG
jgi:site-specific DNA-methyltransferase (adenine-specific)